MSKILSTLHQIENRLSSQEPPLSLGNFELILTDRSFRYLQTPPDLITFARTGGNGVHFGFLTDFGQETDLDRAWIVCVGPMHSPPLQFVARNITDFLSLVCKITLAEEIIDLDFEVEETEWVAKIHEERRNGAEVSDEDASVIIAQITEHLSLCPIPSIYEYVKDIRAERETCLSLKTIDDMGILKTDRSFNKVPAVYHFDFRDYQIANLEDYLNYASHDEKLAFCRTAICSGVLAPDYNADLQILVADTLLNLGLRSESENVRNYGLNQ